MRTTIRLMLMAMVVSVVLAGPPFAAAPFSGGAEKVPAADVVQSNAEARIGVSEARGRAKLLHETIHATLHVVHHQYYRDDEGMQIPSLTLEAVFEELAHSCNIQLRWIAVDAQAMSVDHKPADDFEKNAAKALAAGDQEYQRVEDGTYRFAGAITLSNQCLKCHVPNRRDTKARTAGLVISIPVAQD